MVHHTGDFENCRLQDHHKRTPSSASRCRWQAERKDILWITIINSRSADHHDDDRVRRLSEQEHPPANEGWYWYPESPDIAARLMLTADTHVHVFSAGCVKLHQSARCWMSRIYCCWMNHQPSGCIDRIAGLKILYANTKRLPSISRSYNRAVQRMSPVLLIRSRCINVMPQYMRSVQVKNMAASWRAGTPSLIKLAQQLGLIHKAKM